MIEIELEKGLRAGEIQHTKAIIRKPTAGDIIEATQESERVVATPDGWQLATSNALLGLNILRRQIEKIGDLKGPFTLEMMKKLSGIDLDLLQTTAIALDEAMQKKIKAMTERGRSEDTQKRSAGSGSNAESVS
jgi:phage FluMu protein gp41